MVGELVRLIKRRARLAAPRWTDRALGWALPALLLGAFGGRFGRRAAWRGLMSVALSSAVSAGLAKVAGSPVPTRSDKLRALRPGRRVAPAAASPLQPAASAVGFAAGAAQEVPLAGIPLGMSALWLATRRSPHASQQPGAVLAGAATGVLTSLVTRRLWPVAPRTPAEIRPALTRVGEEPSPDGEGITIVVNTSAGPALRRSPTVELQERLPGASVVEVEGEAVSQALEEAAREARAVGVAGGDGSINAAAGLAWAAQKPLMVVPGGTLNHLARDLGIESVSDAVEAVSKGNAVSVDLATIAGKTFLNTASFGAYVDLVDARERLESRIGKWPAVLVALTNVLRKGTPVEVEIDGRRRSVWMIFIGNCRYHPEGFAPSWRERLDDGQLDVRVVDGTQPFARSRLILAVLTGRLGKSRVYDTWRTREMHVKVLGGPLRLARDGETFDGPAEFEVCKAERPVHIYVPER
ncbi:MAG: hypothetical protein AVDCRST_MAG50-599 [uncultured Acidimicrobiales bacterium]|uniref:DAGKc domain-containing protein n=1 Tax=uncultured Acidimicrobiales bacterium TaxID=310071 RepID=A0A6J4HGA6_9ACTN|nr:MAG: hypothetical protein AVDCRST_MAG50-599 [uncultured Acidimicrobiales bacterium]